MANAHAAAGDPEAAARYRRQATAIYAEFGVPEPAEVRARAGPAEVRARPAPAEVAAG